MSEQAADTAAELGRVEARLDEVEGALSRLDDGTYATCRSCGRPIAEDLLAADPTTSWCGPCAAER
ncbi:MAG: TraR/DksA C4-type zinc finger protein [Acidimicrobiales bacterium]